MNQKDPGEIERGKALQDSMRTGAELGRKDGDKGSITSGSPKNLLLVAIVVGLIFFAGAVFYIAASFADSHTTRDNWQLADVILQSVSTAIFYSALLLGLGTLATVRSRGISSPVNAVARLVSSAGTAVIVLGIAESVCIIGTDMWPTWQYGASQVAFTVATRVFQAGVLAGLALLCLRQARPRGSGEEA